MDDYFLNKKWVDDFNRENGRPPRILHIGNIANNAYLNSKFLRHFGVEADVLCYDYYHIMAYPEWEEMSIDCSDGNYFNPKFINLNCEFQRPSWFAQGSMMRCIEYLISYRTNNTIKANILWDELSKENGIHIEDRGRLDELLYRFKKRSLTYFNVIKSIFFTEDNLFLYLSGYIFSRPIFRSPYVDLVGRFIAAIALFLSLPTRIIYGAYLKFKRIYKGLDANKEKYVIDESIDRSDIREKYAGQFPDRNAFVLETDFYVYKSVLPNLIKLFANYDLVQGYATDGILPLLAGKKYIAYEHGTIRNIPYIDNFQGRMCATTYLMADAVVITNADNRLSAEKLRLHNAVFIPHPVNDLLLDDKLTDGLREKLSKENNANFIVFHPSRQHWTHERHPDWEKGNDLLIKAFAQFVQNDNANALAIFVDWGQSVNDSKVLIEQFGLNDRVLWIAPQSHRNMMRYINACDVLADQFFLGAFGSTMPKAMMCGKPVLIYLNNEMHNWCFNEPPPVVNVQTVEEIYSGLKELYLNKDYATDVGLSSRLWYQKWHSSSVVANKMISLYKQLLDN